MEQFGGKLQLVTREAGGGERVGDVEARVLAQAVRDMDAWITSLPVVSEWRWSFVRARAGLVAELSEAGAPARTARPS